MSPGWEQLLAVVQRVQAEEVEVEGEGEAEDELDVTSEMVDVLLMREESVGVGEYWG
jgi:hypothetical protein